MSQDLGLVKLILAPTLCLNEKTSNFFLEFLIYSLGMGRWGFLTNHARVLLCITDDPGARLRDISAALGITERSAYAIVTDLIEGGYVVKVKDGRRNRYQIRTERPLPEPASRQPTVGELLALLAHTGPAKPGGS